MNYNYSQNKVDVVKVSNPYSGELEPHKIEKLTEYKPAAKQGWQMIYVKDRNEVILKVRGALRQEIFFWIENQFTKSKSVVVLNQERIAKLFKTTRPYVGSVIKTMVETEYLKKIEKNEYKLNPFFYIPYRADAIELQNQWIDEATDKGPFTSEEAIFKYKIYLQSVEWRDKAKAIMKRDNNKCMLCNSENKLHVHHKTYDRLYDEEPEDLITLCGLCHRRRHNINESKTNTR